jgi:uncharacterized protein YegL
VFLMPFDLEAAVEFAENPEPRCPCVLLLDTSGSMDGPPLHALREGLDAFRYDLLLDPVAVRRVEVAVVTFDSTVQLMQDFVAPDAFVPPVLVAKGLTHMGAAIHAALDLIEDRKATYRTHDIAYYRPWIFLITDGAPQGEPAQIVREASRRIRQEEEERRVVFFTVGVEGADLRRLRQISVRAPVKLRGLDFRSLFVWLSRSMQAITHSQLDDRVPLPPTGWAEI